MKHRKIAIYIQVIFLLFVIQNVELLGQKNDSTFTSKNTIYADFATKGAIYSINYDRIFRQREKLKWSYYIGFSILEEAIAFPVGFDLFTGKKKSHVEFDFSIIPYIDFSEIDDPSDSYIYVVPGIGYRFQKPNGGFFIKALVSPAILLDPKTSNFWDMDPEFHFIGSFGLGISF